MYNLQAHNSFEYSMVLKDLQFILYNMLLAHKIVNRQLNWSIMFIKLRLAHPIITKYVDEKKTVSS